MYRSATAEGREHYADQSGAATGGMSGFRRCFDTEERRESGGQEQLGGR